MYVLKFQNDVHSVKRCVSDGIVTKSSVYMLNDTFSKTTSEVANNKKNEFLK